MAKMEVLKKELTAFLKNQGAGLVGVGSLEGIVSGEWKTGISVAIPEPRRHLPGNIWRNTAFWISGWMKSSSAGNSS